MHYNVGAAGPTAGDAYDAEIAAGRAQVRLLDGRTVLVVDDERQSVGRFEGMYQRSVELFETCDGPPRLVVDIRRAPMPHHDVRKRMAKRFPDLPKDLRAACITSDHPVLDLAYRMLARVLGLTLFCGAYRTLEEAVAAVHRDES